MKKISQNETKTRQVKKNEQRKQSREKDRNGKMGENEVYRKSCADKVNGAIFVKQNFCNDCMAN